MEERCYMVQPCTSREGCLHPSLQWLTFCRPPMQVVAHLMGESIFDVDGELLEGSDSDEEHTCTIKNATIGRLWRMPAS